MAQMSMFDGGNGGGDGGGEGPPAAAPAPAPAPTGGPEWMVGTWNVNSVRVRLEHLRRVLVEYRPDVLCLQETKVVDADFPRAALEDLGYHVEVFGQKTYNGVAILSTRPITDVTRGFTGAGDEEQKRLLAGTVGGVRIVNGYFPNGGSVDSERFEDKLRFFADLKAYLAARHDPAQPLVLTGDFNVAPAPEDVHDPEGLDGSICYHPREREALEDLRGWGFTDLFRQFNREGAQYSWWDYREGAFARNAGYRIDHIFTTAPLSSAATWCHIEKEERALERASDHVPVLAAFSGALD